MEQDNVRLFFKVIATVLFIAVLLVGGAYGAWLYLTRELAGDDFTPNTSVDIESISLTENSTFTGDNEKDLKNNITSWLSSGEAARQENVMNILLIGIDNDTKDMKKNSRADAMMILSVNHNTRTIALVSVMRDQYAYVEHENGGKFEKFHHASAYGGPQAQIKMIEQYYKASMDNYALVNFYSLPKIIDALDGVTVQITQTEADYMNNYCGMQVKTGANTIDGETALIYMRIRHQTGGDEARVTRQKQVIKAIFSKLKTKNKAAITTLFGEIGKYMRTGYSSEELLLLATNAVTEGWFDYKILEYSLPDSECAAEYTVDGAWYWKVDYPLAAQKMQKILYGTTNIVLSETRKSWIK
jgi:LCP family protein required for cell wall assembly